jgi:rhodanese-related sulfurtransferase
MRIAVYSDTHGNSIGMNAVLTNVQVAGGVDAHWFVGDVTALGDLAARGGEFDPSQSVIAVCRSGKRSLSAASILIEAGFVEVKSMAGGMIDWAEAGHPVERG